MANSVVDHLFEIDAESSRPAAETDGVQPARSASDSGAVPRRAGPRLASIDLVAAAAVIGAIDTLTNQDTIAPPLQLSLSPASGAGSDLTDAELDQLMGIAVEAPADQRIPADFDIFDLDLEQLLAVSVYGTDAPPEDLTLMAFEDLVQIGVQAAFPDPLVPVIDLTEIALETLQDIQFGEKAGGAETPYRQLAALDLSSALDEEGVNDVTLVDRTTELSRGGAADLAAPPSAGPAPIADDRDPPPFPSPNAPPVARPEALSTLEDTALSGNVLSNDSDPDGDPLTVVNIGTFDSAMAGTVAMNADGSFTYTPPAGYCGADSFDYAITDGHGNTAPAVASIDVIKANLPPVATDDSAATTEDSAVIIDATANDSDPDGDPLTIESVTQGAKGAVAIKFDGTLSYVPDPDFNGRDSFTYTVIDPSGERATATVTVTVTPVNDAPIAKDDGISGNEDMAVTGNVLANDFDPDGDALLVTSTGSLVTGKGGTVVMSADGSFTYTPAADYNGPDFFVYTVEDGNGGTAGARVDIDLAPVNDAPVAIDDAVLATEDTAVTGNVLANDADPDGDALIVTSTGSLTTVNGGTAVMAADGSFTYTPAANYDGPDSFQYTISDSNGGTATALVDITVAPVNDAPVANDDRLSGLEDTAISGNVLTNDADPDGDALTVTSTGTLTTGKGGTVVMAADGSFTYTPAADYDGPDSFLYTVSDGNGGTATARVGITVAPVNDAPRPIDDLASGLEDTAITGNVLTNDADPDGDVLTVTSTGTLTTGSGGTVVMAADGSFTYTPAADFSGADSFTYMVSDGNGGTAMATARLDIAAVNDVPIANDDSFAGSEDANLTGSVLGNDTDPDGDPLTVVSLGTMTSAEGGTVILNADGSFAYTPPADFNGPDSFTYVVSDGNGGTATATAHIDVAAVNDVPVAADDSYTATQGVEIRGNLLDNDHDPDGDPLAVTNTGMFTTGIGGQVQIAADGTFAYRAPTSFTGTDTFTYTVTDGAGGTATATATIDVVSSNTAPVAVDDAFDVAIDGGATGNVLANDFDADGDPLTVTSAGTLTTAQGGMLALFADGSFDYKPLAGFTGTDGLTYVIEDGRGGTAIANITFTVTAGVTLNGTPNADRLVGTVADDVIDANDGDDLLIGLAGADRLAGGAGIDTVSYEDSAAAVQISLESGTAFGGDAEGDVLTGIENVIGSAFDDYIRGDTGDNVLWGGAGDDELLGYVGDDVFMGGPGADRHMGGDGVNRIDYSASDAAVDVNIDLERGLGGHAEGDYIEKTDNVTGSAFGDLIVGDRDVNMLDGGAGDDVLSGAGANDELLGGDGDDTLIGGAGADTLTGGAGIDTASYADAAARVEANLQTGSGLVGDAAGDVFSGIENLIGSAFDDHLHGNGDDNVIDGGAGNDDLLGYHGDDVFISGLGGDRHRGGDGIDLVDYSGSDAGIDVDLETEDGFGGHAEGDFLEQIEDIIGSAFADEIAGGNGTNTLDGGAGNDLIWGGNGDDLLFGGSGDDTLEGERGDDVLNGGWGNDTLLGDQGRETFIVDPGSGSDTDTIQFFVSGEDVIDLSSFGYAAFSDISIAADGLGGSVITLTSGDSIVLLNIEPSALTPADVVII